MSHESGGAFCRARILSLLSGISDVFSNHHDLNELTDLILNTLVDHLPGLRRVVLSIFNRASGSISIESAWGMSEEERQRGVYRIGEGITGKVVETGISAIIPNLARDPSFLNRTASLSPEEVKGLALICVPVKLGREVVGTISVYRSSASSNETNSGIKRLDTSLPGCLAMEGSSLKLDHEVLQIIASMIGQAVELHQARREETTRILLENRRLQDQLAARYHPSQIIGTSRPMQDLFRLLEKVYDKPTPILILGETGAGKELVAQALHYNSPRKSGPFGRFNCAALPENLAESELFGHEKGAFTGAQAQRKGRFEDADGGSLFLDELGELSLSVQAKLLRVLQTSQFERLGGNQTLTVDVRFIAATNRDLTAMIREGTFREDLYYRLNVFPLTLPPLRERGSDILLLADWFVEKYAKIHQSSVRRISSPAIELLMAYHWPGNVRELENVIERAVILSDDGVIHSYHLPPSLQTPTSSGTAYLGNLEQKLETVERETIIDSIKASKGNMASAARDLGLTERVMSLRMNKYNIDWRLYRK